MDENEGAKHHANDTTDSPEGPVSMEKTIQERIKGVTREAVTKIDPTRLESAFDWVKGELDVERIRNEMFSLNYSPSGKQNDLMNMIEDHNKEVQNKLNEKGQAQETMMKTGIRNTDQRTVWERKMIVAGDRVAEVRKELMKLVIVLAKTLSWELSSGHYHALARDVAGAEDGSYGLGTLNDAEARALYDEQAGESDEEFYEGVQREKADPYYRLRPSSYKMVTKEIALTNVTKLKELQKAKSDLAIETKRKEEAIRLKNQSVLDEELDPLDAFMARNEQDMVSNDQAVVTKEVCEIDKILKEYDVLLKALDVHENSDYGSHNLTGEAASRFERIQQMMAIKSKQTKGISASESSLRHHSAPYSTDQVDNKQKTTTSGGPSRNIGVSASQTAQDLISLIQKNAAHSKPAQRSLVGDDE